MLVDIIKSHPKASFARGCCNYLIQKAEQELHLTFAEDYRSALKAFGTFSVGHREFTGLQGADYLNVVSVTKEWKSKEKIPRDWYVIEETHIDDIAIWQNQKGEIFFKAPNQSAVKIADSMGEYLMS